MEGVGLGKKLGQTRPTSMTQRTSRVGGERVKRFRLPPNSFSPPPPRRPTEDEEEKRQKAKVRYAGNRAAGKNVLDSLDAPVYVMHVHTRLG